MIIYRYGNANVWKIFTDLFDYFPLTALVSKFFPIGSFYYLMQVHLHAERTKKWGGIYLLTESLILCERERERERERGVGRGKGWGEYFLGS